MTSYPPGEGFGGSPLRLNIVRMVVRAASGWVWDNAIDNQTCDMHGPGKCLAVSGVVTEAVTVPTELARISDRMTFPVLALCDDRASVVRVARVTHSIQDNMGHCRL